MHYAHTIDPERQFIFQRFCGEFPVAEIIACSRRLWTEPAYSKTYNGIVDISQMKPGTGLEDVRTLIAFYSAEPATSKGRWAVITASPLSTASAMVYKRAMSHLQAVEVFSTWESACNFLQLDLPAPPAIAAKSGCAEMAPVVC